MGGTEIAARTATNGITFVLGLLLGICIYLAPTVLAFLKGNANKGQVIKYQLLIFVINAVIGIAVALIIMVFKMKFLLIICSLGGSLVGLVSLVFWFYVLLNALRDTHMTLLSRFGINI